MGSLHRALRVVALDVEGRALVEGERDVRAELGLHVHRGLRPHEPLAAVEVGAEPHPLLLDREDPRGALVAAALDLLGYGPVTHREDLVAARIGDDRALPAHELVQPAQLGDQVGAGLDEQVERVAQHHVVAELGHLGGVQRLDGRRRRERDEGRRANVAVRRVDQACTRVAVARADGQGRHAGEPTRRRNSGGRPDRAASMRWMRASPTRLRCPRAPACRCRLRSRRGGACAPPASGSAPRARHSRTAPRLRRRRRHPAG